MEGHPCVAEILMARRISSCRAFRISVIPTARSAISRPIDSFCRVRASIAASLLSSVGSFCFGRTTRRRSDLKSSFQVEILKFSGAFVDTRGSIEYKGPPRFDDEGSTEYTGLPIVDIEESTGYEGPPVFDEEPSVASMEDECHVVVESYVRPRVVPGMDVFSELEDGFSWSFIQQAYVSDNSHIVLEKDKVESWCHRFFLVSIPCSWPVKLVRGWPGPRHLQAILVGQLGQAPIRKKQKSGKTVTLLSVGTGGIQNNRRPLDHEDPREYANRCNVQWHRVAAYPQRLGDLAVKSSIPCSIMYVEGNLESKIFNDLITSLIRRIREVSVRKNERVVFLGSGGDSKQTSRAVVSDVGYY
ncbi:Nucleic acid-binding- OB-fold-like protein [Striga hermonthica]|uniref:Nucleic acid-binding- OB-fold-like protein n=1 Tax=Striga hermonthica TaxID=68872 RepID=A0A9N7NRK9_STRHE|nr:Nucleic acid-binding- OB-fold-like protein [Striga hermonthica]